jgi:hypothetical protein
MPNKPPIKLPPKPRPRLKGSIPPPLPLFKALGLEKFPKPPEKAFDGSKVVNDDGKL